MHLYFFIIASVLLNTVDAASNLPTNTSFSHFNLTLGSNIDCASSFTPSLTYPFAFKYEHRNTIDFPGFMPFYLSLQENQNTSECMDNHTLRVAVTVGKPCQIVTIIYAFFLN